jgi:metal-dependent amidase/aminoacylase/carboxypeptidase family protein
MVQTRHVPPDENFILAITKFHAGDCNNVFPDTAALEGCLRCYSNEVYEKICSKIEEAV